MDTKKSIVKSGTLNVYLKTTLLYFSIKKRILIFAYAKQRPHSRFWIAVHTVNC